MRSRTDVPRRSYELVEELRVNDWAFPELAQLPTAKPPAIRLAG